MSCPLQKAPRPDRTEPAEALHLCALGRLGAPDWRPHPGSACSWLLKGPWMPSRLPGSQGPSSVQSKVPRGNWPLRHLGGELSPWSDGLGSSRPLAHWERWCRLLGTAGCGEGRGEGRGPADTKLHGSMRLRRGEGRGRLMRPRGGERGVPGVPGAERDIPGGGETALAIQ